MFEFLKKKASKKVSKKKAVKKSKVRKSDLASMRRTEVEAIAKSLGVLPKEKVSHLPVCDGLTKDELIQLITK